MSDQGSYQSFSGLQTQRDLQERLRMIELQLFAGVEQAPASGSPHPIARLAFTYSDVQQQQLCSVEPGTLITRIVLLILEPFDAGTVSVGDAANNQRLLAEDASDLAIACAFESHPNDKYTSQTAISLYVNPGLATAGKGVVFVYAD